MSAMVESDPALLDTPVVVEGLRTDSEKGLTVQEAARRLVAVGPNRIECVPPIPTWRKIIGQFRSPLIYLLFAAIVASLAVWAVEGATELPVDALVIGVIVVLNAVLGYLQEAHADHAVDALARMTATTATVVRDGVECTVAASEVVPGDVLLLAAGGAVAADARLLSADGLEVLEAALTGESEPARKDPRTQAEPTALGGKANMVFKGTAVTKGIGRGVVTATAMATQTGQIASLVRTLGDEATPLQREIARVSRVLGLAVLVLGAVVIATVLFVFGVHSAHDVVTAVLLGVSLAVAAVPEGLPAIMSVVLALGTRRMAAANAVVKELSSAETLGSASVVCSGKTGTLTTGEMTIVRIITPVGEVTVTGAGYRPEGRFEHDGVPLQEKDRHWTARDDPIKTAFSVAQTKLGALGDAERRLS